MLVGRHDVGHPWRLEAGWAVVRVLIEDRGQHRGAGGAVDRGVVNLGQLGDQTAVVDTLDHVQLPQRTAAVEWSGHDAADHLAQLFRVAGRGDRMVTDVEVDVEVRILDPVGQIETERHLDEAPAERCELIDPLEDDLLRHLETGAPRHTGRVVDVERADVTEDARRLHVEEAHVDAAQLSHVHKRTT